MLSADFLSTKFIVCAHRMQQSSK